MGVWVEVVSTGVEVVYGSGSFLNQGVSIEPFCGGFPMVKVDVVVNS